MRRKEREITDRNEMEQILGEATELSLAMVDDGEPYIVVLNYAYENGCLYMHSAKEGRKIDVLRKNSRVAFQATAGAEVVSYEDASRCTTRYRSVFGTGRAFLIDEAGEKRKALDAIMKRYTGRSGLEYPEKVLEMTLAIRVDIESMTGKKRDVPEE